MKQQCKTYIGVMATLVAAAALSIPAMAQVQGASAQAGSVRNGLGALSRSTPQRLYTPSALANTSQPRFGAGSYTPIYNRPIYTVPTNPGVSPFGFVYPAPWTGAFSGLPNPYNPPWDLAHNQATRQVWEGNASPTPTTIVSPCGYYYPSYCSTDYGDNVYPSVYGEYVGMPGYFSSTDDVEFSGTAPGAFDPYTGQTYDFSYDVSADSNGGGGYDDESDADAVSPDVTSSFDTIAQSWAHHNMGALSQFVSGNNRISVGQNGQYKYSVSPNAYQLMTRDAMTQINTTDFHYTAVRVLPDGEVTGYGVQRYQAPTGDQAAMYVAYTLRRDTSAPRGYSIAAVQTSTRPLMAYPTRSASPATVRSAQYGN